MFHPALLTALTAASPSSVAITQPNEPVSTLDLQRYAGQWHEIAHLPMFFQQTCVDSITAVYSSLPDDSTGECNVCCTKSGQMEAFDDMAKAVTGQRGALKVRLAPRWLAWLPWVWADYWVIEIDPDYRWAMVGGPSRKYMWVLSRSSTMDRGLFAQIRDHARQRGYPVDRLVMAAPLH